MKKILNKLKLFPCSKYLFLIIIAAFGISVSWPLLRNGYFSHQDDLQIIRIFEMRKCFSDFQIPCRWVPDMGWGNGFPLFNFYGVSTYYLGAIISYLIGFLNASKLLFFIALTAGSFGIYLLVKDMWGKYAGLTSAALYLFAPYKALDIYVRGALSESMALTLIPFVFYFGYKLISSSNKKTNSIYFTVLLFIFLITHNIMTVIFLPILLLWLVYWLVVTKFKSIKLVIATLLFAFGLSSFFVLPAFLEKNLVQTESLTRFELDYRANFVSIKQLFIDRVWGYGTSIPGPEGGMNFQIGWPHWILSLLSVVYIFSKKIKKEKKLLVAGITGVFLLSIFMTHNKSAFIWERISILTFFQFPWRFLSLSIFTASILGGFVISVFREKWQILLSVLIITLSVLLNWSYFKPREFYNITDSEKLSGELWEQQRRGAILDYLPKTALEPRESAPTIPLIISGEADISNFINNSNSWKFNANVLEDSQIDIPTYYFPNWVVTVNDKAYPSNYDNLLGRISINLDKGSYEVQGRFKNSPLRTIANVLSLLSVVCFIRFIKWEKYKNL